MTLLYVGPVSLSCDMPHRAAVRGRQHMWPRRDRQDDSSADTCVSMDIIELTDED
jgi:hypothetical protein